MRFARWAAPAICVAVALIAARAQAAGEEEVKLGDKLHMTAPESWKKVQPRSKVVELEFSVPAAEGDADPGRVTMMGAGGSVEQNVDRWTKQFSQPDKSETKPKISKQKIAGQDVHLLDIAGTYDDRPPFAGTGVERKGYRMLAAIITSKDTGNYFIKFYGPERTVADNAEAFQRMIEGLKVK